MTLKTKKHLILNIFGLALGIGGFALGVAFGLAIIGLAGFFSLVYCGLGVIEYGVKGIREVVSFNEYWNERERSISSHALNNKQNSISSTKSTQTHHTAQNSTNSSRNNYANHTRNNDHDLSR